MRISDWSSDVCSSDLELYLAVSAQGFEQNVAPQPGCGDEAARLLLQHLILEAQLVKTGLHRPRADCHGSYGLPCGLSRSEERRVGNECVSKCRCRRSTQH